MQMNKNKLIALIVGVILIGLDFIFLSAKPDLMYFLAVLIVLIALVPFVANIAFESSKQKEKEERFLEFARDLVENVKSGTPISKAIMNLRTRDYGSLTPNVQKLINQLDLGIPLTTGLMNFAQDTKSKVISRAVGLIAEAERSGGEIEHILNSVAESISQIETLKKQQKSSVYSLVVQGYIIFFVFILIVLVLQYYILPMTTDASGGGGFMDLNGGSDIKVNVNPSDFGSSLLWLLVVQSFFAGVVIGKISEGNMKDGLKHSFILVSVTLLISLGAKVFLG
jgi:flagellar protein FlaJ